mmetsp:Transcript_11166/g.22849  ORF Transcript_11166/g.22849 Transcript_11166/m.22849 type:complete len:154 (+) Transcript_11166:609-1070(+)
MISPRLRGRVGTRIGSMWDASPRVGRSVCRTEPTAALARAGFFRGGAWTLLTFGPRPSLSLSLLSLSQSCGRVTTQDDEVLPACELSDKKTEDVTSLQVTSSRAKNYTAPARLILRSSRPLLRYRYCPLSLSLEAGSIVEQHKTPYCYSRSTL